MLAVATVEWLNWWKARVFQLELQNFTIKFYNNKKIYFAIFSGVFPLATWHACSITWPRHVTKRGINAQCAAIKFSWSLLLTCVLNRCLTLFHSVLTSIFEISSLFLGELISPNSNLPHFRSILRHFRKLSCP